MVANRMDPSSKPEETPAAAPAAAAAAPAAGGIKAWLPLIITIVAMPALAFAMTKFVLLPQLRAGLGMTAPAAAHPKNKESKEPAEEAKRESIAMNKLLVNVAGTMGSRYLLVSLSIYGSDPEFKAKMESHEPQLKDLAGATLRTKTLADLEKPGAQNAIRSELISGFNNALGGAVIQEIFFTEFAIQ